MMAKRPRVTLHFAQTLDGRIATRSGHAQWISCAETLRLAHELRTQHDAVLVGIGTVLADNPQLTVRLTPGTSPRRIILDSTLRLPLSSRVLTDGAARTMVVGTAAASTERRKSVEATGAEVVLADHDVDGVSLPALLEILSRQHIGSVLVEGGAGVITSFLRQGLVDRLIVCVAPKLCGAGIEAVGDLGIRRMGDALRIRDMRVERLGDDLVLSGTVGAMADTGDD